MKFKSFVSGAAVIVAATLVFTKTPARAQGLVEIQVQKTNNPAGGFAPAVIDPSNLDGGNIVMDADTSQMFYRLSIQRADPSEFLEVLPADQFPEAKKRALDFLMNFGMEEPAHDNPWANATVADTVVPYYNPAVGGGKTPAYLEFRIVPNTVAAQGENGGYGKSNNENPSPGLGYLVLSLTDQDFPIPLYATEGKPISQYFMETCGSRRFNIIYYDESFIVAESKDATQSMAFLGSEPIMLPDELLQLPPGDYESDKPDDVEPPDPGLKGQPYPSYRDFKNAFVNSPVFASIRKNRSMLAQVPWAIERGEQEIEALTVRLPINQPPAVVVGAKRPVREFEYDTEDEQFAPDLYLEGGIVYGSAKTPGGGLLVVRYADNGELGAVPLHFHSG